MEYTQGAAALQSLNKAVDVPELGRIKSATERVAKVRSRIESFLERFNGGGPDSAGGATEERVSGYRNDLATLFEQIERLEMIAGQLDSIG